MRAIVLAHEKSFRIGPMSVHPSTRTVERSDRREILEPRVMQVLVALAQAPGEVISRDDLVEACWGGRVVGDDAVNRVIARLRRTSEGSGAGAFAVDTITRVGYRLRLLDAGAIKRLEGSEAKPGGSTIGRRELVAGGAIAAGAAALGAGWLFLRRDSDQHISRATAELMEQAKVALWQNTREGQNQAIGLYRQVVTDNPAFADGWAYLSLTYAWTAHYRQSAEAAMLRTRAGSAAYRALDLDYRNSLAMVGLASARPFPGNWLAVERGMRRALSMPHKQDEVSFSFALFLGATGRAREALKYMNLVLPSGPTPAVLYYQGQLLWSAGRIEEFDRLMDEAARLYPTHFALWFTRFYVAMYSGRPEQSLAIAADTSNWPTNVDSEEINAVVRVARAIQSRAPAAIEAATNEWSKRAHLGAGYAENAAQFITALGRIDEAFAVLRAYYFSEGFDCGEQRFSSGQGTYTPHNDRLTAYLFNPALAPLRADARFAKLMRDLRFTDYWRASGNLPDYLLANRQ